MSLYDSEGNALTPEQVREAVKGITNDKGQPLWVPHDRLSEIVAQRNAARDELAEAKASLTETTGKTSKELERLRKDYETATGRIGELEGAAEWSKHEVSLARMGVTDGERVDFLRHKFSKVEKPEDGERPAFDEWVSPMLEANPWLVTNGAGQPKPKPPAVNNGAKPAGNASRYSQEQIDKMQQDDPRALAKLYREEKSKVLG